MCMKLLGLSSQQNLTEIPPKNTPRCLYLSKFPAVINAETCSRREIISHQEIVHILETLVVVISTLFYFFRGKKKNLLHN